MTRTLPCLLLLAACTGGEPVGDDTDAVDSDVADGVYADAAMWACRPGKADDVCARDRTATVLAPDGSTETITPRAAAEPGFDCFYVYPTVDLFSGGLDTDFSEPGARLDPLLSQAAPFTSLCRVYAPYYRQVALNGFAVPGLFDEAYADVLAAFRHFVAHDSGGRPFALIGHSQGTMHLERLLAEEIEADDALHDRLFVAVLLGGSIEVPEGEDVGGSFARTPLCTTPGQHGCVIAWNSYAAEDPPGEDDLFGFASPGHTVACTDPRALAGNPGGKLAGSWFATTAHGPAFTNTYTPYEDVTTPYVVVRDALQARCVTAGGATFLEVGAAPADGDTRPVPPYRNLLQESIGFGMHGVDFDVPMQDLLQAVGNIDVP